MQTKDSHKIRDRLTEWYPALHAANRFAGDTYASHISVLSRLITVNPASIRSLDFGCGPHGGLKEIWGDNVTAYDPYVPAYSEPPWDKGPYDLVFAADVLEHMLVSDIRKFLAETTHARPMWVYLSISTRPASKSFPNGQNVHLTIEPAEWWQGFLQAGLGRYSIVLATADLAAGQSVFGFCRA